VGVTPNGGERHSPTNEKKKKYPQRKKKGTPSLLGLNASGGWMREETIPSTDIGVTKERNVRGEGLVKKKTTREKRAWQFVSMTGVTNAPRGRGETEKRLRGDAAAREGVEGTEIAKKNFCILAEGEMGVVCRRESRFGQGGNVRTVE